jgi:hypothetical protein
MLVDSKGTVYVADGSKRKVKKGTTDVNKNLVFFFHIIGNNRVQRWLVNATSGNTILGTGTSGTASNQLNFPESILFDQNYNLMVVDRLNNRIQFFNLTVC